MTDEIKKRLEKVKNGEVPEGYKCEKGRIIPSTWSSKKLGDVLQKVGKRVAVEKGVYYTQIGIRSHGKGLFHKEPVSGADLGNKAVFWIEKECFVVNIVFAWEQAIGKTTENEVGMIGSHRFPMYRAIHNQVSIDYLLWFFNTKSGVDVLAAASPGGAGRNKTLGQKEFANSKVVFPPFCEQEKIAEILTHCDKVIELKKQLIAEECKQKKWLMQNLLNPDNGMRLAGFEGEWGTTVIGEFCDCLDNLRKPVNSFNRLVMKGCYPYYGANNIMDYVSDYLFNEEIVLLAEDGGNFDDYRSKPIALFVNEKCWVNNHAHILRAKNGQTKYLFYVLEHKDIRNYINGSTRSKLTKNDMLSICIDIPPTIEEQTAIANIISTADHKIELLEQELEQWLQKKKSLMQLLLTGIVRVNV